MIADHLEVHQDEAECSFLTYTENYIVISKSVVKVIHQHSTANANLHLKLNCSNYT